MAWPATAGLMSGRPTLILRALAARGRIEPVPGSPYRDDALGIELASQPDYARIDRTVEGIGAFGRCRRDDVVTRQDLARIGHEQAQQRDLTGRQGLLGAEPIHDQRRLEVD